MTAYEIISKKRDGQHLSSEEINFFINGYTQNQIPDYQMAALLMAIFLQGMNKRESQALTNSYIHSGKVLNLDHIPGIKVDKHSTGGVGDKVSIILAPIVAAAGVYVPMISGRGLGHSGGTLDKLESIPGFCVNYTAKQFIKKLEKNGVCLIGQTSELAPADKKIYALRDVTATVQSIPLIGASIMSKKIAEGIDALVLDVKTGAGAFMTDHKKSLKLAKTLIRIGEEAGKTTVAYITDMNTPLGNTVGNWIEIVECIECLQNNGPKDLMELTHRLSGTMIYLGQKADSIKAGVNLSKELIKNGKAWDKFLTIVQEQGGETTYLSNPDQYPASKFSVDYLSPKDGWIDSINAYDVGMSAVLLGAGRRKSTDKIDNTAGLRFYYKPGMLVKKGDPLVTLYTSKKKTLDIAMKKVAAAISIGPNKKSTYQLIHQFLDKSGL